MLRILCAVLCCALLCFALLCFALLCLFCLLSFAFCLLPIAFCPFPFCLLPFALCPLMCCAVLCQSFEHRPADAAGWLHIGSVLPLTQCIWRCNLSCSTPGHVGRSRNRRAVLAGTKGRPSWFGSRHGPSLALWGRGAVGGAELEQTEGYSL